MSTALRRAALLSLLMLLGGCYALEQHRKASVSIAGECPEDAEPEMCSFLLREPKRRPPYTIGVVEFDDQGATFATPQLDPLLRVIEEERDGFAGRIVVAFAHGWFHDARPGDANLALFAKLLEQVSGTELNEAAAQGRKPRRIIGMFLAWRGAAWKLPGVNVLTFWNRKDTAHRVGERQATEAILRVREATYGSAAGEQGKRNRFVVLGHSFGGALIYSAVSQLLADHLITPAQPGQEPLADAVILFNPAFEAARLHHLFEAAAKLSGRRPALTILTAKSDHATGWAFPAARYLGSLFGSYESLPDPIKHKERVLERPADAKAIGHFDPYLMLDMRALRKDDPDCKPNRAPAPETVRREAVQAPTQRRQELHDDTTTALQTAIADYEHAGRAMTFGDTCLVFRSDVDEKKRQFSIFNVAMNEDIWDGHGLEQDKVRQERVLSFLMLFVPFAAVRPRELPAAPAPTAELGQPSIENKLQNVALPPRYEDF